MKKIILFLFALTSFTYADKLTITMNSDFMNSKVRDFKIVPNYGMRYEHNNNNAGISFLVDSYSNNTTIDNKNKKLLLASMVLRDNTINVKEAKTSILSDNGQYLNIGLRYSFNNQYISKQGLKGNDPALIFNVLSSNKGLQKYTLGTEYIYKNSQLSNKIEINMVFDNEFSKNKKLDMNFNNEFIYKYFDIGLYNNVKYYKELLNKDTLKVQKDVKYALGFNTKFKLYTDKINNELLIATKFNIDNKKVVEKDKDPITTKQYDFIVDLSHKIGKEYKFYHNLLGIKTYYTTGVYVQGNEKTHHTENINFGIYAQPEFGIDYTYNKMNIALSTYAKYNFDFIESYIDKNKNIIFPPSFDDVVETLKDIDINMKLKITLTF